MATASAMPGSLRRGVIAQAEVVWALILRETQTRFGRHQLGYLWALLEPTLLIALFYGSFTVAGRHPPPGMSLFTFIATGVLPYTAFAQGANRVAEAINGNKALLYYPRVRPLDLVMARGALEAATVTAALVAILGLHALVVQSFDADDLLQVLLGMTLASTLGAAVGLVFCSLGQLLPSLDRARGPLLRPLFWVSGVFFAAGNMPTGARDALLYNPILHCTELVRDGWFVRYHDDHVSLGYVLGWILAVTLLGLVLERLVRRRIEVV